MPDAMRTVIDSAEPRHNARGASTRAKLLDAALISFAARGFHGTSTRDIADAAGMSPAGVYAHYRTKEELLFRLSATGHCAALDVVNDALRSSTEPAEQLHAIGYAFVVWHAHSRTLARVAQYEMSALTPEHAEVIRALRRQTQLAIRDVVAAGVAAGVFDVADEGSAARAIASLGIDVARWFDPNGQLTPEEIGRDYASLILRMVGHCP